MICAVCREELVPVKSTKSLWAHDHGRADHDAMPVIEPACARCGDTGCIELVEHAFRCRLVGCRLAGCRTIKRQCPLCASEALGTELVG